MAASKGESGHEDICAPFEEVRFGKGRAGLANQLQCEIPLLFRLCEWNVVVGVGSRSTGSSSRGDVQQDVGHWGEETHRFGAVGRGMVLFCLSW